MNLAHEIWGSHAIKSTVVESLYMIIFLGGCACAPLQPPLDPALGGTRAASLQLKIYTINFHKQKNIFSSPVMRELHHMLETRFRFIRHRKVETERGERHRSQ